jgi:hypothetical protein
VEFDPAPTRRDRPLGVAAHSPVEPGVAVSDSFVAPCRPERRTWTTFLSEFTAVKPAAVMPVTVGGQCRWVFWPLRAAGGCGCCRSPIR